MKVSSDSVDVEVVWVVVEVEVDVVDVEVVVVGVEVDPVVVEESGTDSEKNQSVNV